MISCLLVSVVPGVYIFDLGTGNVRTVEMKVFGLPVIHVDRVQGNPILHPILLRSNHRHHGNHDCLGNLRNPTDPQDHHIGPNEVFDPLVVVHKGHVLAVHPSEVHVQVVHSNEVHVQMVHPTRVPSCAWLPV